MIQKSRPRQSAKPLTEAEHVLWTELRLFRQRGQAFRRQVEIGPFTVDFLCKKAKLIVEVDGEHHGSEDAQWDHDVSRTASMNAQGYRVIRFWNADVGQDLTGVVEAIDLAVRERLRGTPYDI